MTMKCFSGWFVIACVVLAPAGVSAQEDQEISSDLSGSIEAAAPGGVDWSGASQAFLTAKAEGLSSGVVGIEKSGRRSVIPVLLPTEIVLPSSESVEFQLSKSGYFAVYPGANFDLIVNGARSDDPVEPGEILYEVRGADTQMRFSQFGATYHLEFECRIVDGAASCLSENEARAVAARMFVAVEPEGGELERLSDDVGDGS